MAVAALTAAGCANETQPGQTQPTQAQPSAPAQQPSAAPLEIVRIHWSSSNPSLGPHDRTSRATVLPGDFESQSAWDAAIATLLDQTRVNAVATLREYLVARRDQDVTRIAVIEGADERGLGEGGGYASVSFVIDGGSSIDITNLQRTRLSGSWERFWESHIRDEIEVDEPPTPKEALVPELPSTPVDEPSRPTTLPAAPPSRPVPAG